MNPFTKFINGGGMDVTELVCDIEVIYTCGPKEEQGHSAKVRCPGKIYCVLKTLSELYNLRILRETGSCEAEKGK